MGHPRISRWVTRDHLEKKYCRCSSDGIHASQQPDHGCCKHLECTDRDDRNILRQHLDHTTL